jgi:hypothetical protein
LDHQCGFQRNRSTTDQNFWIPQILEKKWEYDETVHQLFIDFKKAYDSVRREVLYNILIEFGIPMKLVRLINLCLRETYSKVHMGICLRVILSKMEIRYRRFFPFLPLGRHRQSSGTEIKWVTSASGLC